MKKCALFLLFCCFAASCSKNTEIIEPAGVSDAELELLIGEDMVQLWTVIQHAFVDMPVEKVSRAKAQLENGATLREVLSQDQSTRMERLQQQLQQHLSSLSYNDDGDRRSEMLLGKMSAVKNTRSLPRSFDTPCFDAWDLSMSTIAANYSSCLGYSTNLITASQCTVMAAIASTSAELAYQACMDRYR